MILTLDLVSELPWAFHAIDCTLSQSRYISNHFSSEEDRITLDALRQETKSAFFAIARSDQRGKAFYEFSDTVFIPYEIELALRMAPALHAAIAAFEEKAADILPKNTHGLKALQKVLACARAILSEIDPAHFSGPSTELRLHLARTIEAALCTEYPAATLPAPAPRLRFISPQS